MAFTTVACDDSSSNNNANNGNNINPVEFCDNVCSKDLECDDTTDLAECKTSCEGMIPLMLETFGTALETCYDSHTCTEMETMDPGCAELATAGCDTNVEILVSTMCVKEFECQEITPTQQQIDECTTDMTTSGDWQMMKCFTQSAISGYTTCIGDVVCESMDADMDACGAEHLGMNK
ncbi:MAG: hypothetical protein CVU59_10410 [Deltaproteobacteria bacterium HGW-Deltaproteobacteria-17]|nr:MAG: hypothetical protein CVU59_10410 [Deltaproteobacteria bacterium HGW-Deltaproteobacteria-17]